jgi:methanogenic corrinoid protein MtbC1
MTAPAPSEDPVKVRIPISPSAQELENALLAIDKIRTAAIIRNSCTLDTPVICVESLIVPALEDIGRRWEEGEVSLSQVYMSGRICETIVDTMIPDTHPARSGHPRIAIAVLEDHHTIVPIAGSGDRSARIP